MWNLFIILSEVIIFKEIRFVFLFVTILCLLRLWWLIIIVLRVSSKSFKAMIKSCWIIIMILIFWLLLFLSFREFSFLFNWMLNLLFFNGISIIARFFMYGSSILSCLSYLINLISAGSFSRSFIMSCVVFGFIRITLISVFVIKISLSFLIFPQMSERLIIYSQLVFVAMLNNIESILSDRKRKLECIFEFWIIIQYWTIL